MAATPAAPGTALQMSARDDQGRWVLSVLAKRSYLLGVNRPCSVDPSQAPLIKEPVYKRNTGPVLETDTDLWPFKIRTDVVVMGHAYNHRGLPSFVAGVRVAKATKRIQVHGDRRAMIAHDGRLRFSPPVVRERVPLSYAFAYGGRDAVAEEKFGNPVADLGRYLKPETSDETIADASPFVYPRNPGGRGYVVEGTKAAVESTMLPNLEHPDDPLSPERLVVVETGRWPLQPVPSSLGWLDYGAFPRIAWLGLVPDHDAIPDPTLVGEVRLGYATPDLLRDRDDALPLTLEGMNGASLGLRVPHLNGGEDVELFSLHSAVEVLEFRLPSERPTLWIDGRDGQLVPTLPPVIHSVVIDPDALRVSVVWRGCAPARRPYGPNEIKTMPFLATW